MPDQYKKNAKLVFSWRKAAWPFFDKTGEADSSPGPRALCAWVQPSHSGCDGMMCSEVKARSKSTQIRLRHSLHHHYYNGNVRCRVIHNTAWCIMLQFELLCPYHMGTLQLDVERIWHEQVVPPDLFHTFVFTASVHLQAWFATLDTSKNLISKVVVILGRGTS